VCAKFVAQSQERKPPLLQNAIELIQVPNISKDINPAMIRQVDKNRN
jgi:hypothetical protein